MLLLALLACAAMKRERCAEARAAAQDQWFEVSDYYRRTSGLREGDVDAARAQFDAATEDRRSAQGALGSVRRKRTQGLVDMATGEVRLDPNVDRELAPAQGAAHARLETAATAEAERLAELLVIERSLERRLDRSAAAATIEAAWASARPVEALAVQHDLAGTLTDTELAPAAIAAGTHAAQVCAVD
jgi:hypothetical protein